MKKMGWLRDIVFYWLGIGFFAFIKVRSMLSGYRKPRPSFSAGAKNAYEYDQSVVEGLLHWMGVYQGNTPSVRGKNVLELGPGADLGTGIILLMSGAERYVAIDANDLAGFVSEEFYREFMDFAKKDYEHLPGIALPVMENISGENRIRYVVNKDFDLSVLDSAGVDLVLSQAAFEHFDDFNKTASQLSTVVKSGALLIAVVDLQTHSRWLKDADPLNIYRYNDCIYNLFRAPGSPSRLRPYEYKAILENNGWERIEIYPLTTLDEQSFRSVLKGLNKRFCHPANEMQMLGIVICATKK